MNKVVIYTRVSSKEQLDGTSLEVQERICRDFAIRNEYDVEKVFVEKGESAKTTNRTELKNLLNFISKNHKGLYGVIVYKVDRLARNAYDHASLKFSFNKLGVKLLSATENLEDTPVGRWVENMLAGNAQLDNEVRTERSTNGMTQAVKNGRYVWGAPLGYLNSGGRGTSNLIPDAPHVVNLIKKCWEYVDTGYTPEEARKAITKEGLKGKSGRPVSKSQFHRMLRNKVYIGIIEKFGLSIIGKYEPIVDSDLFNRVQTRLDGKAKNMPIYKKDNEEFPIRGLVRCNDCNNKLTASFSKGNGGKYAFYRCTHCPKKNFRRDDKNKIYGIESKFLHFLKTYHYKEQLREALIKAVTVNLEFRSQANRKRISEIDKEILQLNTDVKLIVEKNIKGIISDQIAKSLISENEEKITDLQIELNGIKNNEVDVIKIVEHCISVLEDISGVWLRLDLETKKRFQKFLFPQGVLFDGEKFATSETAYCIKPNLSITVQKLHDVTPAGVEPAIFGMKARRPRPLDDGALLRKVYIIQKHTLKLNC